MFDQPPDVFSGQTENEPKAKGRALPFDQGEAVFAHVFPWGILGKFHARVKEIFLDEAVDLKCIKRHDLPLNKRKIVKCIKKKEM